jgi:hypothetical protein
LRDHRIVGAGGRGGGGFCAIRPPRLIQRLIAANRLAIDTRELVDPVLARRLRIPLRTARFHPRSLHENRLLHHLLAKIEELILLRPVILQP